MAKFVTVVDSFSGKEHVVNTENIHSICEQDDGYMVMCIHGPSFMATKESGKELRETLTEEHRDPILFVLRQIAETLRCRRF